VAKCLNHLLAIRAVVCIVKILIVRIALLGILSFIMEMTTKKLDFLDGSGW
jgi:hypothetical protein